MFEDEVAFKIIERLHLSRWLGRLPPRFVGAAFVFVFGFITVGVLALLALLTHVPFVFPSVGPTAFLFFFMPKAPASCPRNALLGHAIGIICGYGALWLTGLQDAPSAVLEAIHWPRVLAAALSLAATGALMILFRIVHPPAGATTLIVSLGFITHPDHLCAIEIAVALLSLQALLINRSMGIEFPLWSAKRSSSK